MSSKFVAYNSSKAALNMQSAVLANRWAFSQSKTGMSFACHLCSLPQIFELANQNAWPAQSHQTPCRRRCLPAVLKACRLFMGLL